jgi:hypothetical protein
VHTYLLHVNYNPPDKMSKEFVTPDAEAWREIAPFRDVNIEEVEAEILRAAHDNIQRVEIMIRASSFLYISLPRRAKLRGSNVPHTERQTQELLNRAYVKRREALRKIDKFWPVALTRRCYIVLSQLDPLDLYAPSYVEDVGVVRDKLEPRIFTTEFVHACLSAPRRALTFKENNSSLAAC